jgi:signal transduction histidine kinase
MIGKLGRLGLRYRLVAALLVTAAVTLAAAAIALLSPLEHRLRVDELDSLADAALTARGSFDRIRPRDVHPGSRDLRVVADAIERRARARVLVFDSRGRQLIDTSPSLADVLPEAHHALATGHTIRVLDDGELAGVVATPIRLGGRRGVLALRGSLDEAQSAVGVVRRAFLVAAAIGLGVALVLGIGLAARLLRRLERLRDAAVHLGGDRLERELPHDDSGDEVADLGRALSAMRDRLLQQEQARRAFVATASHELRTPLASLHGMLELLDEDLRGEDPDLIDAREQVARALRQSGRLAGLARDLLDLSKIDAQVDLRREVVDVSELARAVLAEFELRAQERGTVLQLDAAADHCLAVADPGCVARIVRLLLDNALRYVPAQGRVEVAVRSNGVPTISVTDNGPGIPEAERELIFERFRRGTTSGAQGGFGLGLAIGRELAERMDGELRLEHAARGARFVLRLAPPGRVAQHGED